MPTLLSIEDTIEIAKICNYLASNGKDRSAIFRGGSLTPTLPVQIYDTRKAVEWAYDQNYIARSATAIFYINGTANVGDEIEVVVDDPDDGEVTIGTYTLDSGDTDNEIIATNVAASITGSGYSAVNNGIAVIVTAPYLLGDSINGVVLTVNYTESPFPIIFDFTFENTFN